MTRWGSIFKITVFLLTIPAVLLLALAIFTVLVTLAGGHLGIGSFAFGLTLTRWQLTIAIAMVLGAIIFFFALAFAFLRPPKLQRPGVNS